MVSDIQSTFSFVILRRICKPEAFFKLCLLCLDCVFGSLFVLHVVSNPSQKILLAIALTSFIVVELASSSLGWHLICLKDLLMLEFA